jgi:hypothetical protein
MTEILNMELGTFDMVTAFCSLYYLDDETISRVIRHVSTLTDTFVLQCNEATNIDRTDSHTYVKASVAYNRRALEDNGFPLVRTVAPKGYTRPMVIGRKRNSVV